VGYILGIDQGGTNTRAAVMGLDGNILSYSRTDGCYFPSVGIGFAMSFISVAVESALKDAEIEMNDIDLIVAGITGIDWEGDESLITGALKMRFGSKEIISCNDCEIAYYGGAMKPLGAVICAGSGTNVALFAPDGKKFIMGDYIKSSLQGGSAIAQRAIEAVFESDLGVLPETELTKLFLNFSNSDSVLGLLQRFMTEEDFKKQIKLLVPQILKIADNGDTVTHSLLKTFADELCTCFTAAMKKMGMLELNCDIVLAGSVFMGRTNGLTAMIAKNLSQSVINADIVNAKFEPVVGACILGMLRKSTNFDEDMADHVTVSAQNLGLFRPAPQFSNHLGN